MSVENLLIEKGIPFIHKGKDYMVCCLNPEHEDRDPSLRIDMHTGKFNCFSCGYHGDIFSYFDKPKNKVFLKALDLRKKIANITRDQRGLEIPEGALPFLEEYRNISSSTYKQVEAFTHPNWEDSIVFPIRDLSNKVKAFIARKKYKVHTGNRYTVYPYGVLPPIAPSVSKPRDGKILLVEGYYDAINLIDKGLDFAVANFGTKTTSEHNFNERFDPWLIQGISVIYIMFDGDAAGRKAAQDLKELITRKTDIRVIVIDLPDGEDPGSLNYEEVIKLKNRLLKG